MAYRKAPAGSMRPVKRKSPTGQMTALPKSAKLDQMLAAAKSPAERAAINARYRKWVTERASMPAKSRTERTSMPKKAPRKRG